MTNNRPALEVFSKISIGELQIFLKAASTGGFRKAGHSIGLGQSAISRRVRKLEDDLGVSLFERSPNGSRLTNAGAMFARRVQPVLDDFNLAINEARSAGVAGKGCLRLGIVTSLFQGPFRSLIEEFHTKRNGVDICFDESGYNDLFSLLNQRRIDVVFSSGEPDTLSCDFIPLCHEAVLLAVPSNGPLAKRKRLSWSDVIDQTFLVSAHESGHDLRSEVLQRLKWRGRPVKVRYQKIGREALMSLVGLGFGVCLGLDHWREVQYPNVMFVPIGDESVPYSVVWRPENDNPALRRFLSLARIEAKRNGALSAASRTPDPSP